jgi:DNA-binding beta-propeller fold protein YncE
LRLLLFPALCFFRLSFFARNLPSFFSRGNNGLDYDGSTVYVVNEATWQLVHTIQPPASGRVIGLTVDPSKNALYAAVSFGGTQQDGLYVYNAATGALMNSLPGLPDAYDVTLADCDCAGTGPDLSDYYTKEEVDSLFAACGCGDCVTSNRAYALEDNEVAVIDESTHQQIAAYPLPAGVRGTAIASNPATGELYVGTDNGLVVMDAKTGAVGQTLLSGKKLSAVYYRPGDAYVYVRSGTSLQGVALADGTLLPASVTVGKNTCADCAALADGYAYWDANIFGNKTVHVNDLATGAAKRDIYFPAGESWGAFVLAADPERHRLYVALHNEFSYEIGVVDTQTNAILGTHPVGVDVTQLAVDPVTHWVIATGNGTVERYDPDHIQTC